MLLLLLLLNTITACRPLPLPCGRRIPSDVARSGPTFGKMFEWRFGNNRWPRLAAVITVLRRTINRPTPITRIGVLTSREIRESEWKSRSKVDDRVCPMHTATQTRWTGLVGLFYRQSFVHPFLWLETLQRKDVSASRSSPFWKFDQVQERKK